MLRYVFISLVLSLTLPITVIADEILPDKLVFGTIPNESPDILKARYARFIAYLGQQLHIPVELRVPADYNGVIAEMKAKKIDFAYYGPKSYIEASEQTNAQAFVRLLSVDGSEGYHSLIITLKNKGLNTLADLKGKRWLYPDPESTSGTLVPNMYFYLEARIDPASYFSSINYSGSHEKSVLALKAQEADVVPVSENVFRRGDGQSWSMEEFTIIWRSELIPNALFAYRADLPAHLKTALKEAILNFRDKEGLAQLKIAGFVPAEDADYTFIRKMNDYEKRLLARRQ
ncbi:phosphate/phosphite/phosphonate ABC transporter substrate-binding protein [Beggiatoa leptomitoformis]|uniref:Phosphate/phosphite/phosphonate ABC transporter substrate-binding protein n=1 Tax=Beggiatoa leptomitoformis TaxID=288004 RepID=A0A2N9YEU6_9GAMM|nr:phosphate/phosphite/phosphonate ABC transporter substrate-binding protein [Beggiatoa leptomitoformis]ALG68654.1 phosphate/phosphite/phosphonate ABC transporter substrate-binding protein [Beggiatoa leptomitoformis]AUI68994.1 phosphate/phosphite/phosphonate ABC transporter substrate-binding protein [Beggiatoa leptomitoformis]